MDKFSSPRETVRRYMVVSGLFVLLAFQVIQEFRRLVDLLMSLAFLALTRILGLLQYCRIFFPQDKEIIFVMRDFDTFLCETQHEVNQLPTLRHSIICLYLSGDVTSSPGPKNSSF
jgi:dolichol kinase